MTVRELIEKLEQFRQDCEVLIPNPSWSPDGRFPSHVPVASVTRDGNEYDGCVFLDEHEEIENMYINDDDWEWYK